MATANSTVMADSQEIQRRMAQVRRDLHQEAQQVVRGAQSMTDWKSLVKSHPWIALGITTTVGYLVVPARRAALSTIVAIPAPQSAAQSIIAPAVAAKPEVTPKRKVWGTLGTVFGLVAPIAVRAAQNYAMNYLEQFLGAQTLSPPTQQSGNPIARPASSMGNDFGRQAPRAL